MRYDKVLVIDLEMTCWDTMEEKESNSPEIIEVGLVEIDLKGLSISRKRQIYVKPEYSEVSQFCTNLTGITSSKLKKQGLSLQKAFEILSKKYGSKNKLYIGWGEDNEQIISQIEFYNNKIEKNSSQLTNPFSNNYLNFSILFSIMNRTDEKISLDKALSFYNIDFDGNQHCGLDDAYNTAKLFIEFIKRYPSFLN